MHNRLPTGPGSRGGRSDRFWSHVVTGPDCWEWAGARKPSGYGNFGIHHGSTISAHRFSWELHFGPIPDGLFVCHHCDNAGCVRPDHLFLGTPLANSRDMVRKGRASRVARSVGEANANARLTATDVVEIRESRRTGATAVSIAARYGVTPSMVSQIANRRAWRHIP